MMHGSRDGTPGPPPPRAGLEVSAVQVARAIAEREPLILVDCRTEEERRIASIAGSVHVPMSAAAELVAELLEEHGEVPAMPPVVVHCHHGVRSLRMVCELHARGLPNARSMAGGIHQWSLLVDRSVPTY